MDLHLYDKYDALELILKRFSTQGSLRPKNAILRFECDSVNPWTFRNINYNIIKYNI